MKKKTKDLLFDLNIAEILYLFVIGFGFLIITFDIIWGLIYFIFIILSSFSLIYLINGKLKSQKGDKK